MQHWNGSSELIESNEGRVSICVGSASHGDKTPLNSFFYPRSINSYGAPSKSAARPTLLPPSVNQRVRCCAPLLSPPLHIKSFSWLRINWSTPILPLYQAAVLYTQSTTDGSHLRVRVLTGVFACVAAREWKSSSARWAPVITAWDSFLIILSNINPVGWCRPSCDLMDNVITARTNPHYTLPPILHIHPELPSLSTPLLQYLILLSVQCLNRTFTHASLPRLCSSFFVPANYIIQILVPSLSTHTCYQEKGLR